MSGVIAEYACDTILRLCLGEDSVYKPKAEKAKNQIDIVLGSGRKSIEVRVSCVKNGIEFAVFKKMRVNKGNNILT